LKALKVLYFFMAISFIWAWVYGTYIFAIIKKPKINYNSRIFLAVI
jgi:hypothetical protein